MVDAGRGFRTIFPCLSSGAGILGQPENFLILSESLLRRGSDWMLALACCVRTGCCLLPQLAFPYPCFLVVAERQEVSLGEGSPSAAVPPFPSGIADLFGRGVKALCERLVPVTGCCCPGTVQTPSSSAHAMRSPAWAVALRFLLYAKPHAPLPAHRLPHLFPWGRRRLDRQAWQVRKGTAGCTEHPCNCCSRGWVTPLAPRRLSSAQAKPSCGGEGFH